MDDAARAPVGSVVRAVAGGLAIGAATGVAARAWMRLVSPEPEFTWSGTIAIVGVFAIAGLVQGVALGVRRRRWRRWAQLPLRVLAGVGGLLLGSGAGIVMLPAIVGGSLAFARSDWGRAARTIAATVAVANAVAMIAVLHVGLPWWRTSLGWLAMLALYGVIVVGVSLNLRPLAVVRFSSLHPSYATHAVT